MELSALAALGEPGIRIAANILVTEAHCWLWSGSKTAQGYAQASIGGKVVRVHRWLYKHIGGDVAAELDLDHLCRNRACINPRHLEPVTRKENLARSPLNKPRDTCQSGHALYPDNVYVRPASGRSECLRCKKTRRRNG